MSEKKFDGHPGREEVEQFLFEMGTGPCPPNTDIEGTWVPSYLLYYYYCEWKIAAGASDMLTGRQFEKYFPHTKAYGSSYGYKSFKIQPSERLKKDRTLSKKAKLLFVQERLWQEKKKPKRKVKEAKKNTQA